MNSFEYQVIPVNTKPFGAGDDIEDNLNREARRGWRFVGVVDNKIIMEKPKRTRK